MLQKIKDLMAVQEQIDVIKNNITHTSNSMDSLKSEVQTLKQQIQKILLMWILHYMQNQWEQKQKT